MIIKLDKSYAITLAEIDKNNMRIPWSKGMFESDLDNESTLYIGMEYDGKIVGYCGIWITLDGASITNLVVDKEKRRNNIGTMLLEYIIDYCVKNKIERLMLEVRESNEIALSLYNKLGFVKDGIRKNYYADNRENAILMSKFF